MARRAPALELRYTTPKARFRQTLLGEVNNMSETIRTALIFLIDALFNLYLFVLTIRVMLAFVRADYFNSLTLFVVRLTDRAVKPIRARIPNFYNIETAGVLLILVIEMIKFFLVTCIGFGFPHLIGLPVLAVADMLALIIQVLTYAIIVQVILSFFQPTSSLMRAVSQLTSPIMQPLQKIIPTIGGIDITPIPALIALQLVNILLVSPLVAFGQNITFS